jgi:hypothetical protein
MVWHGFFNSKPKPVFETPRNIPMPNGHAAVWKDFGYVGSEVIGVE